MILTHHYTRITARDENAYIKGRLDELLEMAPKIKHSRINEPRLWTQKKIREVSGALTRIVSYLELHFKLTGSPTIDIHPVINGLEGARLLLADMPWNVEREPEKWREWGKDLDQKVDDFIQMVETIKAQL